MLESIYIGMTGLNSYSRGLQTISNNVANLNTPGFKTSTLRFADLFYLGADASGMSTLNGSTQFGSGVTYAQSTLNFRQGEIRASSSDLDLAIEGRGFLVLLKDGKASYVRTGQFGFDTEGDLIESNLKMRLGVLNGEGSVQGFNLNGMRTNPPKPTAEVRFVDNLSSTADEHVLSEIEVFDLNGGSHQLTIRFTNNFADTVGSWKVAVENSKGEKVAEGEIVFEGSTLTPGKDKISLALDGGNGATSNVVLDFAGGVTGFSSGTSSSLRVLSKDGYGLGEVNGVTVDDTGQLAIAYTNGQSETVGYIALADFQDSSALQLSGNGIFESASHELPVIGRQATTSFGSVKGRALESSNVDLSREFGDLILYQRGYQASSQVISVANEMIQQLFELRGRS